MFFNHYNGFSLTYSDGQESMFIRRALEKFEQSDGAYKNHHINDIFTATKIAIRHLSIFAREIIFEEVRENYFPHLPSRQTCIWVCDKDGIEYWWNTLSKDQTVPFKIFKLALTGSMHKADQRFLTADMVPHDDIRANAFEYWTGTDGLQIEEQEILFEGIIEVLEKHDSLESIQNL